MKKTKDLFIKKCLVIFFQIVVVLFGIGAFALLLWEPQIEGVNVHATNFEIYFKDPFLALVYLGSIPFFFALYQVFKILGLAMRDKIFSRATVKSLRTIKYCAIIVVGFVVVEEIFIILNHGSDDPAGGIFIGTIIISGAIIAVILAAKLERFLQKNIK